VSKFPKIEIGYCDGLGCGRATVCFCQEYHAMKMEYQRVFDEAWNSEDPTCITWERAWRFGTERYDAAWEKIVTRTKGSCIVTAPLKERE